MYKRFIKPILDFFIASFVLILLSPFFIIITVFLTAVNNGSPFFFQLRPGKHEKIFKIVKFKTMTDKKDAQGKLLPDQFRLTKIGKFVRATSLDEIPQLINVVKGDMSIVGPRPLLPEYLPLYDEFQKKRHLVKTGITGWAQVNGRNLLSWQEKFKLDVYYVENQNFFLDFKILLFTVKKVLISEGINEKNTFTTTNFKGNDK